MPAAKALDAHPEIKRLYHMKASTLIEELGIQKIADNFISKFAYACTGPRASTNSMPLDFLNVAQGVVVKLFNFTFDADKFIASLDGKVEIATVTSVEKIEGGWKVTTSDGRERTCENLVVATTVSRRSASWASRKSGSRQSS